MSFLGTACDEPSGGQVEDPGDFTLEAGHCTLAFSEESAPGGLMSHPETPLQRSSVKDLRFELAIRPAIRAIGVAGKHMYIICVYTYVF